LPPGALGSSNDIMCGIAGILTIPHKLTPDLGTTTTGDSGLAAAANQMVRKMHHRGPDDQGSVVLQGDGVDVALGSTRLAILDLSSAGHQPMKDPGTGNWISYNGEIYNFKQLRDGLNDGNTHWASHTDTEVILKAYRRWGTDCLDKLRGMFAFGIWDAAQSRLLLARDSFGMKPLYYYATQTSLVFASEIRTLLASGLVPRKLSIEGLASYLRFGAVQSPLSIIEGIKSLEPGCYLIASATETGIELQQECYARNLLSGACDPSIRDRAEAISVLRSKLEDSVRHHLVSDVPVAAFLSGGIDSSALLALMGQVTNERPRTFTVVFSEKDFSEESYARSVAEKFGSEHREVLLGELSLLQMLPRALESMDQPTIDGINTYVISKAVAEAGIKVALSGLGGDELFGGYPSFRRARQLKRLSAIPAALRHATARVGRTVIGDSVQSRKAWFLLSSGGTPHSTYTISRQLFSWEEVRALIHHDLGLNPLRDHAVETPLADKEDCDRFNAISLYEIQGYMANMLLKDTDQMSMAHSLEVRVPFVDRDVVSFALSLPGEWKADGHRPKPLLLDALGDLLPEEVRRRPKMGFTLPFDRWMHSALQADLDRTFNSNGGLSHLGITDFARTIWNTFDRTPRLERWSRPWSFYILKTWCGINRVGL
jgi:asparagine synthase (glutamine-hydrolysing)